MVRWLMAWASHTPREADFCRGRQTNPILATARRRASGLRERSYDQSDLQRALEKQSQFPAGQGVGKGRHGRLCKTNPSCTRREESVGQAGTPNAVHRVWEPDPPYTRLNCAKQTQFPLRGQEGQRLGRKGVMVNSTSDRPRQNKANSGGWDASGGTTGRAVAWARCAKQTQFLDCGFPERHRATGVRLRRSCRFADSGRPGACRLGPARAPCTNKPNCPERTVQNEANFRPSGRPNGPGIGQRTPATPCRRINLIDREGPVPYDLPLTIRHS